MDSNTPQDNSGQSTGQQDAGKTTGATNAAGTSGAAAKEKKYNIPAAVAAKFPEIIELIKKTESMSDDEREYWFQILPIMTGDQIERLKKILNEEAAQLAKLDDQYHDELTKLNKKHLEEWDEFERKQERESRHEAEAEAEQAEQALEESILGELDEA
jgi:hypothetical protein